MTRDESRAKCFEAMKDGLRQHIDLGAHGDEWWTSIMTFAFDALHGTATVNLPEATKEMHQAVGWKHGAPGMFSTMAATGDLTNQPGSR